jgi:hypothetical protein
MPSTQISFDFAGVWLKGNLHTHTTVSDGVRTPQETIDHYKENGYDFLAITDHGTLVDTAPLDNRGMELIPSQEISIGNSRAGTTTHIVAANITDTLPLRDFDPATNPQRALDLTAERGGFTIIAHPCWSGLQFNDLYPLIGYIGVEIYNHTCQVYRGTGNSSTHIDELIVAGRRPLIFATDDHHGNPEPMKQPDTCGGWLMVKARDKSVSSIVESIRKGLFYSSSGPSFRELKVTSEGISVKTTPVKHITFVSQPSLGSRFTAQGEPLTEYTYAGREGEKYVRIEATDYEGRTAWSNPIYL